VIPRVQTGAPLAFAHRGAPPPWVRENTLSAFRRALASGVRGLESDAWLTADGVAILDHDGLIGLRPWRKPLTGAPRAALPRRMPSLAELFTECGTDFSLSLDVKHPEAAAPVVAVSRAAGAVDRTWLCGPTGQVRQWRQEFGDDVRLVDSSRRAFITEGVAERARALAGAGVDALNMRQDEWTAADVATIHEAGILAFGWDVNRRRDLRRLLEYGCDALYSDSLRLLRRAQGSAGR
jgi:glycerophosphoryl diester phosphodiesterase